MEKLSRLAVLAILSISFTTPLVALATIGAGGTCVSGIECNSGVCSGGYCIGGGTSPITSGSGGININFLKPYSDSIIGIINTIFVPVLVAIAFIVFLWGVYKYFIYHGDSETDKMEGRKYAMWGIIGLAVIFSVWALVNILMGALNLQGGKPPPIPKL